jgi:hypothetical protein
MRRKRILPPLKVKDFSWNDYALEKIEETKNMNIIQKLKEIAPLLSDEILSELYNKSISIHQSKKQRNGKILENNIVAYMLDKYKISYKQQVTINHSGIIVGFSTKKECYHIVDFVIGENIEEGKSIIDYKVISCKTTCRERWTQDDWTLAFPPKLYILLTISDDYPQPKKFGEDAKRKIVTCNPKKRDNRLFKLNFDNLIDEL